MLDDEGPDPLRITAGQGRLPRGHRQAGGQRRRAARRRPRRLRHRPVAVRHQDRRTGRFRPHSGLRARLEKSKRSPMAFTTRARAWSSTAASTRACNRSEAEPVHEKPDRDGGSCAAAAFAAWPSSRRRPSWRRTPRRRSTSSADHAEMHNADCTAVYDRLGRGAAGHLAAARRHHDRPPGVRRARPARRGRGERVGACGDMIEPGGQGLGLLRLLRRPPRAWRQRASTTPPAPPSPSPAT